VGTEGSPSRDEIARIEHKLVKGANIGVAV
jgi:hypothetical protein